MTRDDIIRMAREAHMHHMAWDDDYIEGTERFAAIVAAPLEEEIRRLRFCTSEGDAAAAMEYLAYCVEKDVAAEREACRQLCIALVKQLDGVREASFGAEMCASGIAARSKELNSGREIALLASTP